MITSYINQEIFLILVTGLRDYSSFIKSYLYIDE